MKHENRDKKFVHDITQTNWSISRPCIVTGNKQRVSIRLLCLLVVALLCSIIMIGGASAASVWDGKSIDTSFSGSGSESSPYLISSAAELAGLAELVNSADMEPGKHFRLTTDIDLGDYHWTPIGQLNKFNGVFDGNYHKIAGLNTQNIGTAYGKRFCGLFGIIESSSLKNIDLSGTSSGTDHVGLLVGYVLGDSTITNCYVTGDVICDDESGGGLIGLIEAKKASVLIERCHMIGTVTGNGAATGGLVGSISSQTSDVIIRESTADVKVSGGDGAQGGFIGSVYLGSSATCTIQESCSKGEVITDSGARGGFIGQVFVSFNYNKDIRPTALLIENCYSQCNVASSQASAHNGMYVGGFIGHLYQFTKSNININNCYVSGDISGNRFVGGFCGLADEALGGYIAFENLAVLSNKISLPTEDTTGNRIGGFYRVVKDNMWATNCYAKDNILSGKSAEEAGKSDNWVDSSSEMRYGLTATKSQLSSQSFYENTLGWDFTNVWRMSTSNPSMPEFIWEDEIQPLSATDGIVSSPGFGIVSLLLAGLVCVLICRTRK